MERGFTVMGEIYVRFTADIGGCRLAETARFSRSIGGSAAMTAAAAAKLGMTPQIIGMTGADSFGGFLSGTLRECGVRTETLFRTAAAATPKLFCAFPDDGTPEIEYDRNSAADLLLSERMICGDWFSDTGALYFGSGGLRSAAARGAQMAAIRYASAKNALICYDYAPIPDMEGDAEAVSGADSFLAQAHMVAIGSESLPHLLDPTEPLSVLTEKMHGRRRLWVVFCSDGKVCLYTRSAEIVRQLPVVLRQGGRREAFLAAFLYCALQDHADPRMLGGMPKEKLTRWLHVAAVSGMLYTDGRFPSKASLRMEIGRLRSCRSAGEAK